MDRIIVYLDDAQHAQQQIASLRRARDGAAESGRGIHWVLVGCAPRMTQRLGKWASHSAREKWRRHWSARLFAQIEPVLRAGGDRVTTVLARGPLPELARQLLAEHGAGPVLDARRPRCGHELPPVAAEPPAAAHDGGPVLVRAAG